MLFRSLLSVVFWFAEDIEFDFSISSQENYFQMIQRARMWIVSKGSVIQTTMHYLVSCFLTSVSAIKAGLLMDSLSASQISHHFPAAFQTVSEFALFA